jgi:HD superfamily phosphohydrolase
MSRTYRDPIHKEIFLNSADAIDDLLIKLIDTREMQRLRWIKQLGTGWFTYHGAEGTRFQHSLGTLKIAMLMFNKIAKDCDYEDKVLSKHKTVVLSAALLHDIGHGPFSHSCEKFINARHEDFTVKLIQNKDGDVYPLLESFRPGLSEDVCKIMQHRYESKLMTSIVSSQIDCDRFDYLLRDSHFTGTNYGNFDLSRVIASLKADTARDCITVCGEKGVLAVEDYLFARYSMYLQVYLHKKCLASDVLLQKLFARVKTLMQLRKIGYIEDPVFNWLNMGDKMNINEYYHIDDATIYHHIKRWSQERDIILRDLARRFVERDLFKAYRSESEEQTQEIVESRVQELKRLNLSPEHYLSKIKMANEAYSFYKPSSDYTKGILIKLDNFTEPKEITEVSGVVRALVDTTFSYSWVISL